MKNAIFTLLIIAGLGYFGYKEFVEKASDSDGQGMAPVAGSLETASISRQSIEFVVNLAGEITPTDNVSVRPEVNGQISQLPVDIGDEIAKGELLFALDDADLMIEIESRETSVETANLRLLQAERDFQRDSKLFEENLISQDVFEDSRTNYDLAMTEKKRAQKDLDLVADRLTRTRVVAPFDCTVLTRDVSLGQAVSGSGGFNSGTEVMTIANLDQLMIEAHVNQVDVTRLKQGMEVAIEVEAVPGLIVDGIVERIAPQATIKNNVKGFETRIVLANPGESIQPGMTANITIPVESADDALAAPLAAIFTEPNPETRKMERFAYVREGEQWRRVFLEVGIVDYFNAQVLKGVAEGDIVALEEPDPSVILDSMDTPGS